MVKKYRKIFQKYATKKGQKDFKRAATETAPLKKCKKGQIDKF